MSTPTYETKPCTETSQTDVLANETFDTSTEVTDTARRDASLTPTPYPTNTLTLDFTVTINDKTYNIIVIEDEKNVAFKLPEQLKDNKEAQLLCNFLNEAATMPSFVENFILGNYRDAFLDTIGLPDPNIVRASDNFLKSLDGPLRVLNISPTPYKTTYEEGEVPTEKDIKKLKAQVTALKNKYDRLFEKAHEPPMTEYQFNNFDKFSNLRNYGNYQNYYSEKCRESNKYTLAATIALDLLIQADEAYTVANEIFEKATNENRHASSPNFFTPTALPKN